MTLYASADLLSDFKFFANRTANDSALTDAQIYRLLTLGQQQVAASVTAVFPRLLMAAPALMTTTDSGLTYQINATDEDGLAVAPFGHAELYATNPNGGELYGSSYAGGGWGDVVFEGNKVRLAGGQARTFTAGPYIRYVALPGTLDGSTQPTLPPVLRPLIVYRALVLWANRGGTRDPRPYEEMYQQTWRGSGNGDWGILGLLHTQYKGMNDAATEGVNWWRAWVANGGSAPGLGYAA